MTIILNSLLNVCIFSNKYFTQPGKPLFYAIYCCQSCKVTFYPVVWYYCNASPLLSWLKKRVSIAPFLFMIRINWKVTHHPLKFSTKKKQKINCWKIWKTYRHYIPAPQYIECFRKKICVIITSFSILKGEFSLNYLW